MEVAGDDRITIINEADIETVIASDISFEGHLKFSEAVAIKGRFKGSIESTGSLFIDDDAVVEANIDAAFVFIKGSVTGDVYASDRVELFSQSTVNGDIVAPNIVMESGCNFNGACSMKSPEEVRNEKV